MKRPIRIAFGIVYLAALLFSLFVLEKSGASLFYLKSPVSTQSFSRNGAAFEYQFKIDTNFYDPKSLIILEDQKVLETSWPTQVTTEGNGVFAVEDISTGRVTILISPTGLSDPLTNGHAYQIYIRPYLISSNLWGFIFLVLIAGLIAFLASILTDSPKRKVLFGSPLGAVVLWVNLFDRPISQTSAREANPFLKPSTAVWTRAAVNIILASYVYVLMEWVFYVTKPSFMDILSFGEKLKVLFITGGAVALVALLALLILFLLDLILATIFPLFHNYARHIPFAFLSACLCLILFDNFTYTVFKFGIVDTALIVRVLYALCFLGIFIYVLRKMAENREPARAGWPGRFYAAAAGGLMAASVIIAGFSFQINNHPNIQATQNNTAKKPNIILLSSDGVNAKDMSVYGYGRDTTPFLAQLAKTSLVSENQFTNAGHTLGSITSILTGKLPFATRVLYPPDTLKGADQYEHLPGLLKTLGYQTVQLGTPFYVDADYTNFQNAFDAVNCKANTGNDLTNFMSSHGFDTAFYMLTTISQRIYDRFSHIFFIKDMVNPYISVTYSELNYTNDQTRISCLYNYLDGARQTGQPLFAQIHLLGTHGDYYYPSTQVFSKGESQDAPLMTDFYDDAVLDFDTEVQQVVQYLKDLGEFENTILVIFTDHGKDFVTINRIPLIIHFPGDQRAGIITNNTQIIDVPPTILDFMGIQKPAWMEGDSMLEKMDPMRLIMAGKTNKSENVGGSYILVESILKPPFYQFTLLTVVQCQDLFVINLEDMSMTQQQVENYVNPCSPDKLDSGQTIRQKVGKILTQLGYALPPNW